MMMTADCAPQKAGHNGLTRLMMMTADCAPHQAGHNGLTSVLDYLYDLLCRQLEPNHSYDDRSNLFNLELELVRHAADCI